MAYINIDIDIEEHLDEVRTNDLIEELSKRYNRGSEGKQQEMRATLIAKFKYDPEVPSRTAANIDDQAKHELIDEFLDKISYQDLESTLKKLLHFKN